VLLDSGLTEELIAQAQRGRAQEQAQVGDLHLARLGRYVICFRLDPPRADYSFYPDVWRATAAFAETLAQIQQGDLPVLFQP
jgi:hypothetical protein